MNLRDHLILGLSFALLAVAMPAGAINLFESATNNGANSGPREVPDDASVVPLNIYWSNPEGSAASTSGSECSGAGTGDEVCGYDITLNATGGMTIVGFVPDPAADLVFNQTTGSVRFNGGNPFSGELSSSPVRLATISVSQAPQQVGALTYSAGSWVGSALTLRTATAGNQLAGCTDQDADGACAVSDPCDTFSNSPAEITGSGSNAAVDADLDGVPNTCQCGDTDGDGVLEFSDGLAILRCVNGQGPCDSPLGSLMDADGDGVPEFSDGLAVLNNVSGTGLQTWQLRCGNRPEGDNPLAP